MTSPFTSSQAAITAMAAATLILISQVSQLVLPMTVSESFWNATQTVRLGLWLVAMFVLLLALTGLHARQASSAGRLGLLGYVAASLGTVLVGGDWWYEAFIGPVLREQAPALLATAPSGSILLGAGLTFGLFAAGWVLFGLASLRAGVFPRPATVLLTVGGVVGILTLVPPFQVPLALAVGWMGVWLARSDTGVSRVGEPAVAAIA